MFKRKDKYDRAIDYLVENPQDICRAWKTPGEVTRPEVAQAHCLFQFVTPTGKEIKRPDGKPCGCLSQVSGGLCVGANAWTDELTKEINNDDRIPWDMVEFESVVNRLPKEQRARRFYIFADWQRRLDRELRSWRVRWLTPVINTIKRWIGWSATPTGC
jgi:hypothetical protein